MGAFLLVWMINRVALGKRYTQRASLVAFSIACGITIPLASFGFSTDAITPLQQLPFVALAYGKFALALLIIDLYNAKQVAASSAFLEKRTRLGFPPSPAWAAALVVIAAGAGASFLLPQSSSTSTVEPPAQVASTPAASDDGFDAWELVSPPDSLFTASFPAEPTFEESSTPSPRTGGTLPVRSWALDRGTHYFALTEMRMGPSDIAPDATIERVLEGSFSGVLNAWKANNMTYNIANKDFEQYGEWPALKAKVVVLAGADTMTARLRIVLVGRQLYSLVAISPDASLAERFFGSFEARATDSQRLPHADNEVAR
jgi:hypothetical protein